jgi:hypothetical protein
MNPRRIVATLLEADLPPEESPDQFDQDTIKDLAADSQEIRSLQGVPFHGHYEALKSKIEGARRVRSIRGKDDAYAQGIKVANNTFLIIYPDGRIAVRLHETDVVTVTPDDTITIDSGGWYTRTSQDRICEWIRGGWGLYTLKGDWHWYNHGNRAFDTVSVDGFKIVQEAASGDSITADGMLHPTIPAKLVKVRKSRSVPA